MRVHKGADLHFQIESIVWRSLFLSSFLSFYFYSNILDLSTEILSEPLFTFPVVTRSSSWSWSNCTVTLNVSGAKSVTRAGSWRSWREFLLYCPGRLSNTSPYGGLGAGCLLWFTSSIFLCHLSYFCLFIFLLLNSSYCHSIYSMYLSLSVGS